MRHIHKRKTDFFLKSNNFLSKLEIISDELTALNYLTLDEALEQEKITFEEVSEADRVNFIKAINKGPEMVLILDREELVGVKQNHIINVSILVPGETTLEIPVSCVESGRWPYRGRHFRSKREHAFHRLRSDYYDDIQRSLKERGEYTTDQSKVWRDSCSNTKPLCSRSNDGHE